MRLLAGLALAALCAMPASAQDTPVIHVALSAFEAQANGYYAQDLGLFKQAGLNIDLQQYQGGSAIIAAVAAGSIQIGAGNPLPIAVAYERGIDVAIVAPGTFSDSSLQNLGLLTAATSTIRTGRDFNGKTIAVNTLHSIDQLSVQSWIDKHGGDSRTVKFVEVPATLMLDGMTSGRIDGALFADPFFTAAMNSGQARDVAMAYDAIGKRLMVSAWFASRPWAAAHPDVVTKFAHALDAASAWAVKNPTAAAAVLRKYMHANTERAHEMHARSLDPALLQPLLDAAVRYGVLPKPIDVHQLFWQPS